MCEESEVVGENPHPAVMFHLTALWCGLSALCVTFFLNSWERDKEVGELRASLKVHEQCILELQNSVFGELDMVVVSNEEIAGGRGGSL